MTRIVAGEFGGRRLAVPADRRVRPTADRVREAWFSIVAPRLDGAVVLDLFAGSGALGLEAVSRGASRAVLVDLNPPSVAAIRANVASLGVADRVEVVRQDAFRYLDRLEGRVFDLAFADPPYRLGLAARIAERFRTAPFAAVLGVEHERTETLEGGSTRVYGDTAVTFFEAP
ncbi:MAG: 16S rRNA (guanine(966)-N(2))-methyltransferase RsmD [Gemmatimonadetes bacterium]|nr:16S rRNA (guanine(966)-N(2))-methyltransferase RsmD [Gemmatimonadota bacterium]